MLQDLRFAFRLFLRQRGFFATTVLTMALGIGLSATVFAVVDGVLFRPLPFEHPDRLVSLYGAIRAEQQSTMSVSWPDVVDWRAASRTLKQIEAYSLGGSPSRIRGEDETSEVRTAVITAGFFEVLGVHPLIGRTLIAQDYGPGAAPAAVISYRLWKGRLGADPTILGRTIERNGQHVTVVGVLPGSFVFPQQQGRFVPDVFVPLIPAAPLDRTARGYYLIGRLAPGATLQQARAELDAIALRLKPLFVGRPNVYPGAFDGATIVDLRANLTRFTRPVLSLIFGAVAAVFALACINVIGLLLAHGEDRRREIAVRIALGAGRRALLRQLLTEAACISVAGVAAGWMVTISTFGIIKSRIPAWTQLLGEPSLGTRSVMFAAGLGLVTLIFAALVPWLRAVRDSPHPAAAGTNRQSTGRQGGRHALILLQAALATVLLLAASVMLRSWVRLYSQETGMDADRVIAVRAVPALASESAQRQAFNAKTADALRHVPGVQSVEMLNMPLLQRAVAGSAFRPPRLVRHPGGMDTDVVVTPGYFDTMGIRVLAGRGLRDDDRGRSVVISDELARRYWGSTNPVGETIPYGEGYREIVGVVNSARDVSLDGAPMPTLYHVWTADKAPVATFVVRFGGSASDVLPRIRQAVRETDSSAAITMLSTVEDLMSTSVAERNFNTLLFAVFGGAALAVALVGIYGLVAFVVARREREMGIRLALGATGRRLKLFVISGTLRWVAAGIAVGAGGGLLFAGSLKPFVYQVAPTDPVTLGGAAIAFLCIATLACYIPARRAAAVDPMIALRSE